MKNYIPKKGDVFEWCDEEYTCLESTNYSGVVIPTGETYYQRGFIWNYEKEPQKYIRTLSFEEFNKIFGEL